jgi:hAT family C-terminal dimerisation region
LTFLTDLAHCTKALESNRNTLDNTLPAVDWLLSQYEAGKTEYQDDPFMAASINSGWAKLDKYYSLTSDTPAYVGAVVLHPAFKWQYVHEHWQEEWWQPSKIALENMWKGRYMPTGPNTLPIHKPRSAQSSSINRLPNKFSEWKHALYEKVPVSQYTDEYTRYCEAPPHHDFEDVRDWWLAPEQQAIYPNLSKMALNLLSIPAMSAAPERLFSSCKITLTDRRNKLSVRVVEALECLRSWYQVQRFDLEDVEEELKE